MEINSLKNKIKSESPFSGIAVPILIVLLSIVLVAGITRMLSTEKGYVNLVEELSDKTFGNRWVAAFELSKYLASSQIPKEDIPWLENKLMDIYKNSSNDPRTRNFLILAAGSLRGSDSLKLLEIALEDSDQEVLFAAVSSLANFTTIPNSFNWNRVLEIAKGEILKDEVLQQTAIVVLTHHEKEVVIPLLKENILKSESKNLKDVSAIALMHFNLWDGFNRIEQLLKMNYNQDQNAIEQSLNVEANKINVIQAAKALIEKNISLPQSFLSILADVEKNDQNVQVKTRAKEVLLMLKK